MKALEANQTHSIQFNQTSYPQIINMFTSSHICQLPVLDSNQNLLGLLNVLDYLNNPQIPEVIQRDYISYSNALSFEFVVNTNQSIYPAFDSAGAYKGFVEKSDLLQELFSREKNLHFYLLQELDTILELYSDGIFITDGDGKVLRINRACERMDGVRREDILGRNMKDLVFEGVYSQSVAIEVLKSKKGVRVFQTVKDGKLLISTGVPVFSDDKVSMVIVNVKDVTELNNLKKELEQAKNFTEKMSQELEDLRMAHEGLDSLVLASTAMKKIISLALKVAKVDSTVLIQGESGVGKGVISGFIHSNSERKSKPFMKIDCASIPETLIESELFGYERGAFTGAEKSGKIGLVELADSGSLFLDEIGEIPLNVQAKLLRVIQERKFMKVGGKELIPVDIRIIAATNKDLSAMVRDKEFREDLYYRLNVIPLHIPPLRERREDIQPLVQKYLDIFNSKFNEHKIPNPELLKILLDYDWPGNVRELENMIERLVVTSNDDIITINDLPKHMIPSEEPSLVMNGDSYKDIMDQYEERLLKAMTEKSKSTYEMGRYLKLDASTVRRKLKKHHIKTNFEKDE